MSRSYKLHDRVLNALDAAALRAELVGIVVSDRLHALLARCEGLDETDRLVDIISAYAARLDAECTPGQARYLRSVLVEILDEALDD